MEDMVPPMHNKKNGLAETSSSESADQSTDSGFSNRWVVYQTFVTNYILTLAEDTGFVKLYYDSS